MGKVVQGRGEARLAAEYRVVCAPRVHPITPRRSSNSRCKVSHGRCMSIHSAGFLYGMGNQPNGAGSPCLVQAVR